VSEAAVEGRATRFDAKGMPITASSAAAAAAMLRVFNGTACPGLPQAPSVSGFSANFSGVLHAVRSAARFPKSAKSVLDARIPRKVNQLWQRPALAKTRSFVLASGQRVLVLTTYELPASLLVVNRFNRYGSKCLLAVRVQSRGAREIASNRPKSHW